METPKLYKGKPIARKNDEIYYGDPADKYIVYLKILSSKDVQGVSVADKIHVSLIATDTSLDIMERMVKQGIKNGMYNALDVGAVWLNTALASE